VDTVRAWSCGLFMKPWVAGLLTARSGPRCAHLACGGAWAPRQPTITTDRWWTGVATVKPCSPFSVFLGCPFDEARRRVWACSLRHAAPRVPAEAPLVRACDDTTPAQGRPAQRRGGLLSPRGRLGPPGIAAPPGRERGARRQARATPAVARAPRDPSPWPGTLPPSSARPAAPPAVSLPEGAGARPRGLWGRSTARPADAGARGRRLGPQGMPARPAGHGPRGRAVSALQHARGPARAPGGQPPPTDATAAVHAWLGRWHPVLPGRLVRVVAVRRPAARSQQPGQRHPSPPLEACFTTALARSLEDSLRPSRDRGAVAIALRDRQACNGLGQDQGRTLPRLVGATTCRLVRAAARTRWGFEPAHPRHGRARRRDRPWSRQPCAPSPRDLAWAGRDAWHEAGGFPRPRWTPDRTDNHAAQDHALPAAA